MKICWDNLEELIYNKRTGKWYRRDVNGKIAATYLYKEKCKTCGDPFLHYISNRADFCCIRCASLRGNNSIICLSHVEEKIKSSRGRKNSDEHRKKISEGLKRYYTDEIKNRTSERQKGENNSNWKGALHEKGLPPYDLFSPQLSLCEEVRRNCEDLNILETKCAYCGKWYIPTYYNANNRSQYIKGNYDIEYRFYCSDGCKKACPIYGKSPDQLIKKDAVRAGRLNWLELNREVQPELRQMVLKRDEWTCQKCGYTNELYCHHIYPVATDPLLSADIDNCITLCKKCHKEAHKQPGCDYGELKIEIC